MRRVGITTFFHRNWNFGGMLQAFALCQCVCALGFEAEQICMSVWRGGHSAKTAAWNIIETNALTNEVVKTVYEHWRKGTRILKKFRTFQREVPHGRYLGNLNLPAKLNDRYDCIITGSDQVWNPLYYTDDGLRIQGLAFAAPGKRTISYAPSLGPVKAAIGREKIYAEILNRLDFISVRERSAQQFLQPLTDKPIAVVLDPTLLLTRQEWNKLTIGVKGKSIHLFAYFLNESSNRHDEQLHQIANQMQLPLRCIADELERYPRAESDDRQILDAGPKEFLGEIRDAEMVLTNSFHGTVFSMLFHKPFWVFKRNRDSDQGSMNSRITDFLEDFGLAGRLLEDGEVPSLEKLRTPIDYDAVDCILEEKREFSMDWLKTALEGV